jgi:hypothetical protein
MGAGTGCTRRRRSSNWQLSSVRHDFRGQAPTANTSGRDRTQLSTARGNSPWQAQDTSPLHEPPLFKRHHQQPVSPFSLHLHDRPIQAIGISAFFGFSAPLRCQHPPRNPSTSSILIHRHPAGPPPHHTLAMARPQQDQFIDEDDEEEVCPLCVEEFDLGDKNFRPCPCGYQVSPLPSLTHLASNLPARRYASSVTTTSRRP